MKGGSFMTATSQPLIAPDRGAAGEAAGDREFRRQAVAEGELAHDHRGQHHDRADRQVDARGQDHEALRRRDDADDLHLLQDQRQREGREEFRPAAGRRRRSPRSARSAAPATALTCSGAAPARRSPLVARARTRQPRASRLRDGFVVVDICVDRSAWTASSLGFAAPGAPRAAAAEGRPPPLAVIPCRQRGSAPAEVHALLGPRSTRRPRPACR
jgi:hypothetical protein